jgi:hypothetical protein
LSAGSRFVVCTEDLGFTDALFCWIFGSRRSPPLKAEDYTLSLLESGSLEYLRLQPLGFVESLESLVEDQSSAGKSVVGCTTRTNKSLRSWKSVAVGRVLWAACPSRT